MIQENDRRGVFFVMSGFQIGREVHTRTLGARANAAVRPFAVRCSQRVSSTTDCATSGSVNSFADLPK